MTTQHSINPGFHNNRISTTNLTIDQIVAREIKRLQDLLKDGLNPVYKSFDEYMYDFYPDFSWNDVSDDELNALLQNDEWLKLSQQIKDKYNFCFKTDIEQALECEM